MAGISQRLGILSAGGLLLALFACKTTTSAPTFATLGETAFAGCDASAESLLSAPNGKFVALSMTLEPSLKPASGLLLAAVGSGKSDVFSLAKELGDDLKDQGLAAVHAQVLANRPIACCQLSGGNDDLPFQASDFADEAGEQLRKSSAASLDWLAGEADRLFYRLGELNRDEIAMAENTFHALDQAFQSAGDKALPFEESHILNRMIIAAVKYADHPSDEHATAVRTAISAGLAYADHKGLPKQGRERRRAHLLLILSQVSDTLMAGNGADERLMAFVETTAQKRFATSPDTFEACLQLVIGSERALKSLAHLGADKKTLQRLIRRLIAKAEKGMPMQADILTTGWNAADISVSNKATDSDSSYQFSFPPSILGAAGEPIEVLGERAAVLPVPSPSRLMLSQFTPQVYPDFGLSRTAAP